MATTGRHRLLPRLRDEDGRTATVSKLPENDLGNTSGPFGHRARRQALWPEEPQCLLRLGRPENATGDRPSLLAFCGLLESRTLVHR